ncbi:hypothetical protein ACNHUS_29710 [Actinomycetes bacterium M1A6_2h]
MASSYWPEHSPPQRRWLSLISYLRDRGWTVSVVCPVAHYGAGPDNSAETRGRAWRRPPCGAAARGARTWWWRPLPRFLSSPQHSW